MTYTLHTDEPLDYRAGPMGVHSRCNLRVYTRPGARPLVVLTELPDNPGMSVTNAIETLAARVRPMLADMSEPIWVEQGLDWGDGHGAGVSLVEFDLLDPNQRAVVGHVITEDEQIPFIAGRYSNPVWKHLTREMIAERWGIDLTGAGS